MENYLRLFFFPKAWSFCLNKKSFVCVWQFVDRFQKHLKGRKLTEPIRLVTFVETAMGLLNFKVIYQQIFWLLVGWLN